MAMSTSLPVSDPSALPAKKVWEDPCLTLERTLELRAQGGPFPGRPPEGGPYPGFLGPLGASGGLGQCL